MLTSLLRKNLIASVVATLLLTNAVRAQAETPIVRDESKVFYPRNASAKEKRPLVVLLHAFKVTGGFQKFYFGLQSRMHQHGFVLYVPGTIRDSKNHRFWNAMPYFDHERIGVDDVGFLKESIEEVIAKNNIDRDRVYLLGHSNGGMMAHRMACEHADLFAGVASLAGSGMPKLEDCRPSSPVSILEIHAKNDVIVPYAGMNEATLAERLKKRPLYPYAADPELVRYPSAPELVQDWALKNGCDLEVLQNHGRAHYAMNTIGKETSKISWSTDCRNGTSAHLWTLDRGGHVPRFNAAFKDAVIEFLLAQKKRR